MAGQRDWKNRGASTNEYLINPDLEQGVYYQSESRQLFGKINDRREVTTVKIMRDGNEQSIDVGNDSPIWEKNFGGGVGECRFTLEEEMEGMPVYGPSDPIAGNFQQYKHSNVYVRKITSPKMPVVDEESQFNVSAVIPDLLKQRKGSMSRWREKEVELDAFRALLDGGSRGLLSTTDGGLGITLPGASAGQNRSCYNTYVEGQSGLTTPNYTRATHEGTLSTLVAAISGTAAVQAFDWETHKKIAYLIETRPLALKPVKIGGKEYKAVAIIDPRNVDRLLAYGGTLATAMATAYTRGMDNPVLNRVNGFVLDDICYIPSKYIEYFRPTADGSTMRYLPATSDPRSSSFANTSNVTMTIVLGAGAILRGRRKKVWFSVKEYDHDTGADYCVHYYDGWMRNEWSTKDGRTSILNDSSLVVFNGDPGVGVAYST